MILYFTACWSCSLCHIYREIPSPFDTWENITLDTDEIVLAIKRYVFQNMCPFPKIRTYNHYTFKCLAEKSANAFFRGIFKNIMVLLAGTPPDWRYCQINSIIIDYREQSVLIEWVVWV